MKYTVPWLITAFLLVCCMGSCWQMRHQNDQTRGYQSDASWELGKVRETFGAVLKEAERLPKENQQVIFELIKKGDDSIGKFMERHCTYGGPESVSQMIASGRLKDPTKP